ncbi:hypothetical protein AAMO2058_000478700 [Amorphochlora amoebiformis]
MGVCKSAEEGRFEEKTTENKRISQSRPSTVKDITTLLKTIPLLARMEENDRKKITTVLEEQTFQHGDRIIRQGDDADRFYIMKEGKASVIVGDQVVGGLAKGEFFGEQGFLEKKSKRKRNASIIADGNVTVFSLKRDAFYKVFDEKQIRKLFPKRQAVSGISGGRITGRGSQQMIAKPLNAITAKLPEQHKLISDALYTNPLMKTILNDDQVKMMLGEFWKMDVKKGKDVITEGDNGDNFYVVISGMMGVYKKDETDPKRELRVAERGAGQSFGEIALMYNCARKATVRCEKDASLWAIDRFTFKRITTNVSAQKLQEYESFLSKVSGFDQLTKFERNRIAEALEEVKFKEGEIIIKEGDNGDSFFVLKKGRVMDYKTPGSFFGERAILKDEKRAATCTALGSTICLMLKRDVFELLLGPLHDLMSRDMDEKYKQADAQGITSMKEQDDGAKIRTHFKGLKDFRTIGILGKGSFGSVKLVEANGKRYALKAVGKERVVQLGQQEHIMNERNIMLRVHHPFVVILYQTFQDENYLYFLLEPSLGGELFSVLRERTYFKHQQAKFFAASVILVFEYLHSKDIIYRDLKPENLLLDGQGYLKVTDFGFAKEVKDRTWTLCGTPDYLAPEIISSRSHNKGVDWWTLGILIYEMLVSYPPFYDNDPMKVYAKIMQAKVRFPKNFIKNQEYKDAESLIRGLLTAKPSQRLGNTKGGAQLVKDHPYFKKFNFEDLVDRKIKAPIVQKVNDRDPLKNFEDYDDFDEIEKYKGNNKDFEKFDSN